MIHDVAVIGGGNAGLCAALAARSAGASVVLLERAPREWRGGNSKYTRNLRCVHNGDELMPGEYAEDAFFDDLARVAGDEPFDRPLTRFMIERSRDLPRWMAHLGVLWQAPLNGTLHLARTNRFFLGGGKALVNHYFEQAGRLGVQVEYETAVRGFRFKDGRCTQAVISRNDEEDTVQARAFVIACGSYESDRSWLARYWGDRVDNFVIRGCAYNDGAVLDALLEAGASSAGKPGAFHGTAVDARSPSYDGGIVTRVDSIPFGIVVNKAGERFYDEGEDLWPKRYAIWGRLIAEQDDQAAYSIFDARATGQFIPPAFPPVSAPTIAELAHALDLDGDRLSATVQAFNAAASPTAADRYDLGRLDACTTTDLSPAKSNWAVPLDTPPYYAFPLRPGITFTYFGVGVDETARVSTVAGDSFRNVFAAGEAMAGNILRRGYLAGVGMTIGTAFGRVAGEEAASCARS